MVLSCGGYAATGCVWVACVILVPLIAIGLMIEEYRRRRRK